MSLSTLTGEIRSKLTEIIEHKPEAKTCDKCGSPMEVSGATFSLRLQGETFQFCSTRCRLELMKTIMSIEQLTKQILLSAAISTETPSLAITQ